MGKRLCYEVDKKLQLIDCILKKMHRKHYTYTSFNRKFRSILKFSKLNENFFSVRIKGYHPVCIKIEDFPHGKYATIFVHGTDLKISVYVKYTKDLMMKILQYKLLTVRQYPYYY